MVGTADGALVGASVGLADGAALGASLGCAEGVAVGAEVGVSVDSHRCRSCSQSPDVS